MRTIEAMIRIYCLNHHQQELCDDCRTLYQYAIVRIDKCVFGPAKPACNNCSIHCYSPKMKEQVKTVMRFAGPRMLYKHPVMAINHLLKKKKTSILKINKSSNH